MRTVATREIFPTLPCLCDIAPIVSHLIALSSEVIFDPAAPDERTYFENAGFHQIRGKLRSPNLTGKKSLMNCPQTGEQNHHTTNGLSPGAGFAVRFMGHLSSTIIQLHYEKFNYLTLRYKMKKMVKPLRRNKLPDFKKR